MITGIKRASTAAESKKKYFLTRDLITSHFRRDSDKAQVKALLNGERSNLSNFLNAATVIHVYHFLGIHTKDTTEMQNVAVDSLQKVEDLEKKEIFQEIQHLFQDTIDHEVDIFLKDFKFQLDVAKILYGRKKRETQLLEALRDDIEDDLVEIIRKLPSVYFYDYVGDLTGYNAEIQEEILDNATQLKATSVEIEKDLKSEEPDKYIEISKLYEVRKRLQQDFEFSSFKSLELETIPIKMIINKILEYTRDYFPISKRGLRAYIEASHTITKVFNRFKKANSQEISIDDFETEVKNLIKEELIEHSKKNANHFVYYLQNLLSLTFPELMELLEKYGITNIPSFVQAMALPLPRLKKFMSLFNITDLDIKLLQDPQNNLIASARGELEKIKLERQRKGFNSQLLHQIDLRGITDPKNHEAEVVYDRLCRRIHKTPQEIQQLLQKKHLLRTKILQPLETDSTVVLTALGLEHTLENLAKDIYFNILGALCRQLARILECYVKVKEDKTKVLVAFKRILDQKSEDWVVVKLEELIIDRVMRRQEEFSTIFSAHDRPFLVNGFILARFTDKSLQEVISDLNEESSPVYAPIGDYQLPKDIISPVSYVLAFDLLKRFELQEQFRRMKVEVAMRAKEEKKEQKQREIKKRQEANTLDWIERKITTSLMRITSGSINPNQLYWSEKDTKVASEGLKRHCEIESAFLCPSCGQSLAEGAQCPEHDIHAIPASPVDLFAQFYKFCQDKMKSLYDRVRIKSFEEIREEIVKEYASEEMESRLRRIPKGDELNDMIDGERLAVAQRIAKKIGKLLDNTLYKKYRAFRRKQR